jgi:Fur family ferric uptake transcriptional regulator
MTLIAPAAVRADVDLESAGHSLAPVERFAEKYREFLASKGLRMTHAQAIVVEEIFSSHEHFDAEQLIERLAPRRDRRVSRSTIYRALEKLEEAGLIRKVARQDNREIYEHDYGYPQHDHLICRRCGTLIEFHNEAINDVLDEVARRHGFRMEGHRLEVSGLCDRCSRPPETRPKKLNLL